MRASDEAKLIARCQDGDSAAWDELFERHYAAAFRFVFQLGYQLSHQDTEEICQEAFLAVIRNLDSFKGGCAFQTWLFRIATNKARDFLEKQTAAKRGGGQTPISLDANDPETGLAPDPPSSGVDPGGALLEDERMGLLFEALEQLDEPCREIVRLRYFGELSYEELALALQLHPKTVSSRLSRCLDRLGGIVKEVFAREKLPYSPV